MTRRLRLGVCVVAALWGSVRLSAQAEMFPVVVTWNLQTDDDSEWHARTAIDYLMSLAPQPQIVVLQEAHESRFGSYQDELQNMTGTTWTGVFQHHCAPGGWDGSGCSEGQDEGVAIFTSLPIVDTDSLYFPYDDGWHSARGAVRAAIDANGTTLQVFAVHLSNSSTGRNAAMEMLKSWAGNYSTPQLVGGDFNADPDQIAAWNHMGSQFVDAWSAVGSGPGFTCSTPDPWMHLDYLFTDQSGRAQPLWNAVATDPGTFSDHYPVIGQFVVR